MSTPYSHVDEVRLDIETRGGEVAFFDHGDVTHIICDNTSDNKLQVFILFFIFYFFSISLLFLSYFSSTSILFYLQQELAKSKGKRSRIKPFLKAQWVKDSINQGMLSMYLFSLLHLFHLLSLLRLIHLSSLLHLIHLFSLFSLFHLSSLFLYIFIYLYLFSLSLPISIPSILSISLYFYLALSIPIYSLYLYSISISIQGDVSRKDPIWSHLLFKINMEICMLSRNSSPSKQ